MTTRARVIDLGYGEVITASGSTDLRPLLEQIDADVVTVNGRTLRGNEMWTAVLRDVVGPRGPDEPPPIIGVPTTWGSVRCAPIVTAASAVGAVVIPRAVLIARSHADLSTRRCAVVETTRLPSAGGSHDVTTDFDISILVRVDGEWRIDSSAAVGFDASALEVLGAKQYSRVAVIRSDAAFASASVLSPTGARTVTEIVDDSIDMVLVDGADPAQVALGVAVMEDLCVAGRVVAVDRTLIRRFGAPRARTVPTRMPASNDDVIAPSAVRRWAPLVGGSLILGLIALAVVGLTWPRGVHERSTDVVVDDVALTVPHDWRRSSVTGADDAPDRTVFVDADDGRRLLVVRSAVRSTATLESVATSLSNRIGQRGDDVVTEFSSSTRYGGREVISYREAPGSGSAVRWYVVVEDGVQVSIGCQGGDAGESVDGACQRAVRSVRVR